VSFGVFSAAKAVSSLPAKAGMIPRATALETTLKCVGPSAGLIDDYLRTLEPDGCLVVAGGAIRLVIPAASRKVLPVIDASFPLERAADAFWLYERDHARGKIVIAM
jgi:hypothetical protein